MNGGRRLRTEWTASRWMGRDDADEQTVFGDLNLVDPHSLGKWKQWRLFHHHLASETSRVLQISSGSNYTITCQPVIACKRAVCPKSGHEPYHGRCGFMASTQCNRLKHKAPYVRFAYHNRGFNPQSG